MTCKMCLKDVSFKVRKFQLELEAFQDGGKTLGGSPPVRWSEVRSGPYFMRNVCREPLIPQKDGN